MNINTPKITVLMPVYNGEEYLRAAIDSILEQTFTDFEFLIIDDGSKDESVREIQSYKDDRIRLIKNEKNIGLVDTLNKGLALSKGLYIARMDQDDISVPNRLEIQFNYLESHHKVGVCGGWIRVFGIGDYIEKYPTSYEDIKSSLLFFNALAHPTIMMRKKLFDDFNLCYLKEYEHAEDYDLWQRCSFCFEVVNIRRVLLHYRTSMSSYCRVFSVEQSVTLQKIDQRQLGQLGIIANAENLKMQKNLRDGQYVINKEYVLDMQSWLKTLIYGNEKNKCYNEKEFSRRIRWYWFKICEYNCSIGFVVWKYYICSSLCHLTKRKEIIWMVYLFFLCCKTEMKKIRRGS